MDLGKAIEELRLSALQQEKEADKLKRRFVYSEIEFSLNKKPRIKLVRGLRGIGKTILLLQLFSKMKEKALYFSADSPVIKEQSLYELGKESIKTGYSVLLIDEVHTYLNWKNELKALHDEFSDAVIIASGSAPLALVPERREQLFDVQPLTFGEYIYLKINEKIESKQEWESMHKTVEFLAGEQKNIEIEFQKYLKYGGFPFFLDYDEKNALNSIYYSLKKSIREDSVFFLKMSKEKIFAMENLLIMLATSSPGELSITSFSKNLSVSKTTAYEIIDALIKMKIIVLIRPYKSGPALIRGEPKILFVHPNLRESICSQLNKAISKGAVREEIALFSLRKRGWEIHTIKGMKKTPDYVIKNGKELFVIEIGGESKTRKQLSEFKKTLLLTERQLITLSLC